MMRFFLLIIFLILTSTASFSKTKKLNLGVGEVCNSSFCQKDLKCMNSLDQKGNDELKGGGEECNKSIECMSLVCRPLKKNGPSLCENIKRCYSPLKLGDSCNSNPYCDDGKCEIFNSNTNSIGECARYNDVCRNDSECCTGACRNNVCVLNFICKKCSKKDERKHGNNTCCEGLIEDARGICVPDMPTYILPDV